MVTLHGFGHPATHCGILRLTFTVACAKRHVKSKTSQQMTAKCPFCIIQWPRPRLRKPWRRSKHRHSSVYVWFPGFGCWGSNLGRWIWWQVPLPAAVAYLPLSFAGWGKVFLSESLPWLFVPCNRKPFSNLGSFTYNYPAVTEATSPALDFLSS